MITLPLTTEFTHYKDPEILAGVTATKKTYTYKGKRESYKQYRLPEFGPSRLYYERPTVGLVIALGGQNYLVQYHIDYNDGMPIGGMVALVPSELPETKFSSAGESWRRLPYLSAFGQPRFIQGPVFPSYDGKRCACNFLTIEDGWGDAGNINILLALNAKGKPAQAWMEASCC